MELTDNKHCPHCAAVIPSKSPICIHCGKDLQDSYYVTPDGLKFGIAIKGEIKIHGLSLQRAQELADLMNSIMGS
jgi:hypothetical protein